MISYDGIDEAELIHALWHGQQPCNVRTPAFMQELLSGGASSVTVESVRADIADWPRRQNTLSIDYYRGRALKVNLDEKAKEFCPRLYDRDAGPGRANEVVDALRRRAQGVSP